MARGRPFGVWEFSFGPYSRWNSVDAGQLALVGRGATPRPELMLPLMHSLDASMVGRSSVEPWLNSESLALVSPMVGRSGAYMPLRFYWDPVQPCVANWVVQPKPPYDCLAPPPGQGGYNDGAYSAGPYPSGIPQQSRQPVGSASSRTRTRRPELEPA